ncbi:hypothetical protein [Anaeromicropila populeti]|uniref:Uncharacterized protein n=1 Tax=Anaeromicropila populeti TaxID=37658 RepID=A0A1I6LUJ5_9FIRM|nr:hypothetical protein [Anaeromicropila populeti]SFS06952.1 hypothetical protein SAMN05661086_03566 [Anaeromicropila populeti]
MKKVQKSLKTKLTVTFILFALILSLPVSIYSYVRYKNTQAAHYKSLALNTAETVVLLVNSDKIAKYYNTLKTDYEYWDVLEILNNVKEKQKAAHLYIVVPDKQEGLSAE